MVYMVKATAEMPLSSPLSARPSSNIASIQDSSGRKTVTDMLHMNTNTIQFIVPLGKLTGDSSAENTKYITTMHMMCIKTWHK